MKKLFLTILILLVSVNLYSQVVTFFGGIKPFKNTGNILEFTYIDQSPSSNSIYKKFSYNKKELFNLGVSIGGVDALTKLYMDIGIQFFFNKMFGGDVGVQVGYVHPYFYDKKILVFPSLGIGYGYYDLDLGDFENPSDYVQINNVKFYEKSINVKYIKDFISLRPSLNIYFDLGKKTSISFVTSYMFPFEFKDVLKFSHKENVEINSNNLNFLVNGSKNNKLPYSLQGFEVRLGIGYVFGGSLLENEKQVKKSSPEIVEKPETKLDPDITLKKPDIDRDTYNESLLKAKTYFNNQNYLSAIQELKDFPLDHKNYDDAIDLMNKAIAYIPKDTYQNFVTVSGYINCNCNKVINGFIIFEEVNSKQFAGKCKINSNGYYCIVLPLGNSYLYYIDSKDFYPISRTIDFTNLKGKNHVDNLVLISYDEMRDKQVAVRINNIFFDFNESTLKSESFPELDRLYKYLYENSDIRIEISGHTDNFGSDDYNLKLSQDRANTVKDYLVNRGIDIDRIISKGYGESKPVESNENDEGRQLNRRVEFKIIN